MKGTQILLDFMDGSNF